MNTDASYLQKTSSASIKDLLWPLFFLAFGTICITLRQSDYFHAIPGDLADARFNNLILEHLYRWLLGKDSSLWSPGFFYPYQGALAFSDNHFGSGVVYIFMRLLGLSPEMAYIGWYTFAAPLNYLCSYFVFKKMGFGAKGSAVGAFIFTFAFDVSAQASHAQLSYRFAIPLALLAWQRFIEQARAWQLAKIAFWVTVQFYCSIYLGYFLLLLLAAYFTAQLAMPPAPSLHKPLRALVGCARSAMTDRSIGSIVLILVCCTSLGALFYPYLHYSHLYGFRRDFGEVQTMLPRAASYILMDGSSLWGKLSSHIDDMPMRGEQQMFFGASACLLAAIGVIRRPSHQNLSALFALLLLVILTLCVHGHSVYTLFYQLPLANAIRAVARIGLVMIFPVALMACSGFDWLASSAGMRFAKIVSATLLVALMLTEYAAYRTNRVPLHEWRDRLADLLQRTPANTAKDAILYIPAKAGERPFLNELDGMQVAQALDRDTLNGYSGNWPVGFAERDFDPCSTVNNRLTGYVALTHQTYDNYVALMKRVVVIGGGDQCMPLPSLLGRTHFRGKVPETIIKGLSLSIGQITVKDGKLIAIFVVQNHSIETLPSVSDDNHPIRFSWRIVPVGSTPAPDDGWDPRKDLAADIPAGKSQSFEILIDPPHQSGRYRLEANMVQEMVAWFHQLGMPIGKSTQVIDVKKDGSVQIVD